MPDAPNPSPGSGHEHLFKPVDIDRALTELRRITGGAPLRAGCVLCGVVLDLTATLSGTSTARRDAARDRAARAAAADPTPRTPPQLRPGLRADQPDDSPPAWGAGVPVEG